MRRGRRGAKPTKRENQLVNGGIFLFCFGILAAMPLVSDRQLLILSWLGGWSVPIGISSMVVGAVLWVAGKLQDLRNGSSMETQAVAAPDQAAAGPSGAPLVVPNTIAGPAPRPNVLSSQGPSEPPDRA
jgi:hypothetical protein